MSILQSGLDETFSSRKIAVSPEAVLHYVAGGAGTPVVLIHGFPQSWYTSRKIMPALAKNYLVIAPDLRGCGDSDKQYGPFDSWTLAKDVHDLLESLDIHEPIHIVGHDMGAPVALAFAARYRDAVRSLVYIDEPVFGVDLDSRASFSKDNPNMVWWWPFQHQPALAEMLIAGHEREYFDFFVFAKTHVHNLSAMTEYDKQEYVRHLREAGGLTGALGGYRDVFVTQAHLELLRETKLDTPVLGVNGQYALKGTADALRAYAENVSSAVIADSGHFIAEEQPEQLVNTLKAFFDDLTSATE